MVEADVTQLERRVAERDRPLGIHGLVRQNRVRILQDRQALLGSLVRDDSRASVLEGLAAGDVVEVMVAVDQILDRLARDLLDLVDVGHHRLRAPVADRVGGDHARGGDHEHRLMVAVTEDIDVIGALDLGGRERGRRGLLGPGDRSQARGDQRAGRERIG